jgi:hypothetical protein
MILKIPSKARDHYIPTMSFRLYILGRNESFPFRAGR